MSDTFRGEQKQKLKNKYLQERKNREKRKLLSKQEKSNKKARDED